jgi:hypothetical protein
VIVKIKGKKSEIIDVFEGNGSEHDFSLFKRTIGDSSRESLRMYADLGYVGIKKFHEKSKIPRKPSKNHKLGEKDKAYNKRLSRKRAGVEHINAKIKTFKIMAYPYRNRRAGHKLRMSLVCGLINFDLRI